jgi:GntR family transcriptional regulator
MASFSGRSAALADEGAPWPKHHRVYLVLRQEIEDGTYGPDAPMPSEKVLAQQFGVSRITIRKAMERLSQEGSVDRERGRGTFARRTRSEPSPVEASLSGNIENLVALGLETEVTVIEFGYGRAPAGVCAAMACAPDTVMQRAVRIRSLDGRPFSHLVTWLPEEIGRTFDRDMLGTTPILKLIEQAGHSIATAKQTISACLATPDVAALLEVEPGSALLSVHRVVFDRNGRPVEWIRGLYRPDTYAHQSEIARSASSTRTIWNT